MNKTNRQVGDPAGTCATCSGQLTWRKNGKAMTSACRPCANARRRERMKDPVRRAEKRKVDAQYRAENRDALRAWHRTNREVNKEAINARKRELYAENPGPVLSRNEAWRQANPEEWRRSQRVQAAKRRIRQLQAPDDGWSFDAMSRMVQTGEHTCFICEKATADTVEHLMPVSLGGGNVWANLAMACQSCNTAKGGSNRAEPLVPGSPGWDEFLEKRRGART